MQVVDEPEHRCVERALVVGKRLDIPPHRLSQHRLHGRPDTPAHAGTQPQRPIGRHRPEPLGLCPRGATIVGISAATRIGAGAPHFVPERLDQRLDIDGGSGLRTRVDGVAVHRESVAPVSDRPTAGKAATPPGQYDHRVISVCMATFNGARFVSRQIETILTQLEPGDELVVSDDSSTDGTVAIVRGFADDRIRLLEGNTFRSPLRNFEHAIGHAHGDTLVLADQDDIWLDNKLSLVRELFAAEPRRPYLIVLDAEIVDDEERPLGPSVLDQLGAGPGLVKNLWTNRYLGCCMAFSSDLLEVALPIPGGAAMHDIWLGQLCERLGTTQFVRVVTMRYRRHDANVTGFEIRLDPVRQIARRASLAWFLTARTIRAKL